VKINSKIIFKIKNKISISSTFHLKTKISLIFYNHLDGWKLGKQAKHYLLSFFKKKMDGQCILKRKTKVLDL
jgi:hypothetical protein